jgi:Domain of unknown function (DUF4167)
MRNGQNKRMRGRNRKSHNPLTRVYESNGPDVKIRGTGSHVAEKYMQLARDAQSSGDPVAAENYFQHAEHYFRLIAAAQDQFRQTQPFGYRPEGGGGAADSRDDNFDDGEDEPAGQPITGAGEQPSFGTRDPQPYLPRDAQFFSPREQQRDQQREHQHREHAREPQQHTRDPQREPQQQYSGRSQHSTPAPRTDNPRTDNDGNVDRLPSFITGGGQPQAQPQVQPNNGPQGHQSNGYDNQGGDRFPLHRRRRRHRGPRPDMQGGHQGAASDGDDEPSP